MALRDRPVWKPVLVATALCAVTTAALAETISPVVNVGIRKEARPFAYFDNQTKTFEGFLVDLCLEAVQKTGFQMKKFEMNVADRDAMLSGKKGTLSSDEPYLDLMCDPTTITLQRLDMMAAHAEALDRSDATGELRPDALDFSPIVFLANGSYIERLRSKSDGGTFPGVSNIKPDNLSQTCVAGPGRSPDEMTSFRSAGVVQATTAQDTLDFAVRKGLLVLNENSAVCAVSYPDHLALITAFCEGELAYYFGDLDIIRAYHNWYLDTVGLSGDDNACPIKVAPEPISYEPYAFIVSSRIPGFRQKFNRALYAIFHDGKTIGQMGLHFGENKTLSPFVQSLFSINKIPSGYGPD